MLVRSNSSLKRSGTFVETVPEEPADPTRAADYETEQVLSLSKRAEPRYNDVGLENLRVHRLLGGISALAILKIEDAGEKAPTIVIRLHNSDSATEGRDVGDVIGEAASDAGAGPRILFKGHDAGLNSSVTVMAFLSGGNPSEDFLFKTDALCGPFGSIFAKIHSIPLSSLTPFPDRMKSDPKKLAASFSMDITEA